MLDGVAKATASVRIVNQSVLTAALAVERHQRPIRAVDQSPGDQHSHWLPILSIE